MIITRSPLRVSLGGGGTDLPSYSREHGGFLMAGAIDKYVYINIHPRFFDGFLLKYSHLEEVSSIEEIRHPIIREALRALAIQERNLEITSMADIPAGTGLGSSGSFTTALLKALHAYKKNLIHPHQLAEQACHIEIDILKEQDDKSKRADAEMTDNLHFMKELAFSSKQALEDGNLAEFGRLMNVHWERKKQRSTGMSSARIDQWYDCAMSNGALGGKLIGAGGGGFLMFYAGDKTRLRHAMREQKLKEVRFRFDFEGTRTVSHE